MINYKDYFDIYLPKYFREPFRLVVAFILGFLPKANVNDIYNFYIISDIYYIEKINNINDMNMQFYRYH